MMKNKHDVNIFETDDRIIVTCGGRAWRVGETVKAKKILKHFHFLHEDGVFIVREKYEGGIGRVGSVAVEEAVTRHYRGCLRGNANVTKLHKLPQLKIGGKISCNGCVHSFSFGRHGPKYRQKAIEHLNEEHIEEGEADESIIEEMLEEEKP